MVNLLVHKPRAAQMAVNVVALALTLAASLWMLYTVHPGGVMASQMGNWPAPFGVTAVADGFSATLLCVTAAVALGVYCYLLTQTPVRFTGGYFHSLYPLLILGVNWAFIAGRRIQLVRQLSR